MKRLGYLFGILVVLSCKPDAVEQPPNLLPDDKMVKILEEVHLAESRVGKMALRSVDSSKKVFANMEARIMKKYQTDTLTYRQSYRYYMANPERFNEIYKKVIQSLEAREKSGKLN